MKTNEKLTILVNKIQSGEQAAFEDLYKESYKYLHTCVIHIVKDETTAQDVLQDTYIEIFKNISQLKEPAGYLGWAASIANRKCFAFLKKNKDILADDIEDNEGNQTDYFETIADDEAFIPENLIDDQEKVKIIRGVIDELSDLQRACVIGFYYNEQKQDEIAKELGIPVNTVKSHLNRAKAKLKDSIENTEKKQGVKLYSFAPFMALLFAKEVEACEAKAVIPAMGTELSQAMAQATVKSVAVSANAAGKAAGIALKTKLLIGGIAGVLVIGSAVGIAMSRKSEPQPEPQQEIVEETVVEAGDEENTINEISNTMKDDEGNEDSEKIMNSEELNNNTEEETTSEESEEEEVKEPEEETKKEVEPVKEPEEEVEPEVKEDKKEVNDTAAEAKTEDTSANAADVDIKSIQGFWLGYDPAEDSEIQIIIDGTEAFYSINAKDTGYSGQLTNIKNSGGKVVCNFGSMTFTIVPGASLTTSGGVVLDYLG